VTHKIVYLETSQTLRHVPPERITSASYVIEDLFTDEAGRTVASGSATVDTTTTTTDAASGPAQANPRKVPVASTTGFAVGDHALIASVDGGTWERFVIDGLSVGDYLVADIPLVNAYASGANVYGIDVTAPFPDGIAANESHVDEDRPYRVVWEYTIRGLVYRPQEQIRLVRASETDVSSSAVAQKIRDTYPDVIARLPEASRLDRGIIAAESFVHNSLRRKGVDPHRFMGGELLLDAVYWRTLCLFATNSSTPGDMPVAEWLEYCERKYNQTWNDIVNGEAGVGTLDLTTKSGAMANKSRIYRSPFASS
jgi:hypothetical protein